MTSIKRDESYEDMAASFQVAMFHFLNQALSRGGVANPEDRRKIVADFARPFSSWIDQCWFKDSSDNRVFPCVAFSSRGPAADCEDLGEVYSPSTGFSFGDYVGGNLVFYYEESLEQLRIETGPSSANE